MTTDEIIAINLERYDRACQKVRALLLEPKFTNNEAPEIKDAYNQFNESVRAIFSTKELEMVTVKNKAELDSEPT